MSLWLPILLSAVAVFIGSSVIHMVLRYHWSDMAGLKDEDGVREALRKTGAGPGDYSIPHCRTMAEMADPGVAAKFKEGPVGFVTVLPNGPPAMGKSLVLWFVYSIVVSLMVAYVAGRVFSAGANYLEVFRIAGTAAFLAYAGAEPVQSIWRGRNWSTSVKMTIDGLIYALLTAGVFGWLWPR
jgi:hypothetical protein